MNPEKILAKARNHPNDVRFSDLLKLAEALGYRFDRQNGSHRIYIHPGVPRKLNFQPTKDGKAKEYQVRELLRLADEFGSSLEVWS